MNTNLSLEQLEADVWKDSSFPTPLVEKIYKYRRIPVKELSIEQLRLLISQNIGLEFLVPHAIIILSGNPLAEGDCYEGDLLNAVISVDKAYWENNKIQKEGFQNSIKTWLPGIESTNDDNIHRQLLKTYPFSCIHNRLTIFNFSSPSIFLYS